MDKTKGESKNFCVMPWTNLATETNGKCKICCVVMTNKYIKKSDESDFHIQSDPIEDIWNSEYLKNVRKKILAGEWVSDCFYCKNQEDTGQSSPRQSYNDMWYNEAISQRVQESKKYDGHVTALPSSLEPRPGILCNLKCNMCWSMSSSKIFSERKQAVESGTDVPEFLLNDWKYEVEWASKSDFSWAESELYEKNLEKCIPTLKRLYFTGGEPTLIKSNLTVLKKLIQNNRTDLMVSFTTNLQVLPPEWIEVLLKFQRVEVTGSVDGFEEVNDYIRFPSQWDKVSKNITIFYDMYPQIFFSLMYVVQVSNLFSYLKLIRWIADTFPERQIQVIPTMLQGPEFLRPELSSFSANTTSKI